MARKTKTLKDYKMDYVDHSREISELKDARAVLQQEIKVLKNTLQLQLEEIAHLRKSLEKQGGQYHDAKIKIAKLERAIVNISLHISEQ